MHQQVHRRDVGPFQCLDGAQQARVAVQMSAEVEGHDVGPVDVVAKVLVADAIVIAIGAAHQPVQDGAQAGVEAVVTEDGVVGALVQQVGGDYQGVRQQEDARQYQQDRVAGDQQHNSPPA